jgi:peptide/nickel transport system substrate-binding protein
VRHVRRSTPLLAILLGLSLVAAACGGGGGSKSTTPTSARQGGDLVFGAEQELDCADWINSCAGAAWGAYAFSSVTMPRPFDPTTAPGYKANSLVSSEPKLEAGPPQKVTYNINPKAVWSDGQPITSHDFKYTWQQIVTGTDIYDTTGYIDIADVSDADPHTAVVTFKKDYAAWRDLFGGFYGVFPSHLLEGKDRNALMKDGYQWSGGPWKLDHWTKGTELKLVPNTAYWGQKPHLNSITWKFTPDSAAEQQNFKSGQVSLIYPQAQPGQEQLKTLPGVKFDVKTGLDYEALWFNTAKKPLDSVKVRQALAYATDRDAIVKQLFEPIQPGIKHIDSVFTPAYGAAYTTPFAKYTPTPAKVTELMTSDGWAKGPDGIWAKGGQKATLEVKSTTGNHRRELTEQIIQSQWKAAGFNLTISNEKAGVLFGEDLPKGNFQLALYAQTPPSADPGQCVIWCTKNIPGPANNNSGQNYTRLNDKSLDPPWSAADLELNDAKRLDLVHQGNNLVADLVPALPIDPFPDIIAYNSNLIGGPVDHNFTYGPLVFSNEWFLKG